MHRPIELAGIMTSYLVLRKVVLSGFLDIYPNQLRDCTGVGSWCQQWRKDSMKLGALDALRRSLSRRTLRHSEKRLSFPQLCESVRLDEKISCCAR